MYLHELWDPAEATRPRIAATERQYPLVTEAVHLISPVRSAEVCRRILGCFAESGGGSKSKKRKRGHDLHASGCQLSLRPSHGAWHKGAVSAPVEEQPAPETLDVNKLKKGQQVTDVVRKSNNKGASMCLCSSTAAKRAHVQTICLLN